MFNVGLRKKSMLVGFLISTISLVATSDSVVCFSKLAKITQVSEFQKLNTDLQQRGSFVVTYKPTTGAYAGKTVYVFGSLHTAYKDGIPFKMLHKLMDSLPKDACVLYENTAFLNQAVSGKQLSSDEIADYARKAYEPTFLDTVKGYVRPNLCNEMSLIAYKARKNGIHFECADLPYKETLQFFKDKKYSEQDVFSFALQFSAAPLGYNPSVTKPIYDYILKPVIKKNLHSSVDLPFEGYAEFCTFKKGDLMFFEHINARDKYALTTLFKKLDDHNTVMIAFGGWHWNLWQDVLVEQLGTPTVQYYNEFLAEAQQ